MNRKRKDDWFSGDDWNIDDIFNNLDGEFRKMRKQMDSFMREALEGNNSGNDNNSPFVFGFSVKSGPDGFPIFEDFGNTRMKPFGKKGKKPTVDTSREPLTDINETDDQIAITVELPGVNKEDIDEVILATSATIEGQTTAYYIQDSLKHSKVKITKLAQGLPVGGEIESLDDGTLFSAFKNRVPVTD